MYRPYQPILPCSNKYLQQKWDTAKYEEHKKRIQTAKPIVDTSAPAIYSHLQLKLGKLKLEEDRRSIIEKDNRLLLERISYIMRTKGQIDNKNDYKAKSLNGEKQKQELQRVNQENRAILDRITKAQPHYQVQRWHEEWQRAEKYMANIARYPRRRCKSQRRKGFFSHMTIFISVSKAFPVRTQLPNSKYFRVRFLDSFQRLSEASETPERRIVSQWVNELNQFIEDEFKKKAIADARKK
ncbi:uncharacterized protein CFAP97D2 [Podargus strigoides]